MKSKKLCTAAIAVILLLSIPPLVFGGSEGCLVPVTIGKADKTRMEGYVLFSEKEMYRMASWGSAGLRRGSRTSASRKHQRVIWESKKGRKGPPTLLMFTGMKFTEGGHEIFITYGHGKKTIGANNFFSGKRIRFTTRPSHADILPQLLAPGEIMWIKRTGKPEVIR